jgi:hypothetical protein
MKGVIVDIKLNLRGSFDKTERYLKKLQTLEFRRFLQGQALKGVNALRAATPGETGLAAESWGYRITQNGRRITITWTNSDTENGFPVAVMLQYGYGTGTGGYVQGRNYINPAMKPVFDDIERDVVKAVRSL